MLFLQRSLFVIEEPAVFFRTKAVDALRKFKYFFSISPFKAFRSLKKLEELLQTHDASFVFFFPYTHMGGAERVHSDIVHAFSDQKCLVLFTGFSSDQSFLSAFDHANSKTVVLASALYWPFTAKKARNLLTDYINSGKRRNLLGSNSEYYFRLLPALNSDVFCVDLIHAFKYRPGGNLSHIRLLPYARRLNKRIFISQQAMLDFKSLLTNNLFGSTYTDRLVYIPNGTVLREHLSAKSGPLRVIFVGRDSPEKRFYLFEGVAQKFNGRNDIIFLAAGISMSKSNTYVKCLGELNQDQLNVLYDESHVLVLTSSREGFPMVIMEAMAAGVVPVSTAVGDIPNHINTANGVLVTSDEEDVIVESVIKSIQSFLDSPQILTESSEHAYDYAKNNFGIKKFRDNYRSLFGL